MQDFFASNAKDSLKRMRQTYGSGRERRTLKMILTFDIDV